VIVRPTADSTFIAIENIITGNVCFYGATGGEAYIAGVAGERFCVRNSGVDAVVEGLGDHGCEYMTGGRVICLGRTGRNFGAGMSGGVAYVIDSEGDFVNKRLNHEMVKVYPLMECEDDEIAAVRARIESHVDYTASVHGQAILSDWNSFLDKFVKVLPEDFERVLNAMKRAEDRGLEGDEAVQAAFEENVAAGH
jgi:glutamate synthase (ferredoxin)